MAKTKTKINTLELIKKTVQARASKKTINPIVDKEAVMETVGIPGLMQPSDYDLNDELGLLDGYNAKTFTE
jgi:hypothetical protein